MSLNNESCNSSDDESFRSSWSMIFSSGRSSSPTWSRSSSMTSGISAKSSSSSESRRKSKATLGPISRPTPTELKSSDSQRNHRVQQQNTQKISPKPAQMKNKRKNLLPVQPKIIRPAANMPQPQGWYPYSNPAMYGPPVPQYSHLMAYYPPPAVQMPIAYPVPMPYSVPMPPPAAVPPMYAHPQARYVSVQAQYTYTWTYVDYV